MRAEKIRVVDRGIVAMNGDDQWHLQPAGQRESGKPGRREVRMDQDGLVLLDAPEEKGRITEYLEGNLLEPVPDLRCPGIVAQQDGMIGGKRKARRGSLGADIQGRELGKRGSLCADEGHAWRQEWLRKDDHDRLSLDTAHGPSSRLRVLDVGRDRSTHLHAVSSRESSKSPRGRFWQARISVVGLS